MLDGHRVNYRAFYFNRALRLLPLLFFVLLLVGLEKYLSGENMADYMLQLRRGFYGLNLPNLPNGAWSLVAEIHCYLLLPLLLLVARHSIAGLWLLLASITLRMVIYFETGSIQTLAYTTIVGRFDQFLLGMLAFHYRRLIMGRHLLVNLVAVFFLGFYAWFNERGGYARVYILKREDLTWVFLPAVEGLVYGVLICWYDGLAWVRTGRLSRLLAKVGTWSYSIYLLHFFVVFRLAEFLHANVIALDSWTSAIFIFPLAFLLILPLGYLGYRFIEKPFLHRRVIYIRD